MTLFNDCVFFYVVSVIKSAFRVQSSKAHRPEKHPDQWSELLNSPDQELSCCVLNTRKWKRGDGFQ